MNVIKTAVKEFFGKRRVCYVTPGTDNHSANFYGDTHIIKLNHSDVVACIETARDNWNDTTEQSAIDDILADMQFEKPPAVGSQS